ncbi:MAG TPA: ABC transporter permease [Puia sp.]|nr:ABC transporter permease [Puia sp.]
MLRNYFKIAFRNLWRHRVFSSINILGLAVGMSTCFLIYLYVSFELSYDKFNTKADHIYRLVCDVRTPTETINTSSTSMPMAVNIKRDFPEVESFVRIDGASLLVRKGDVKFQEEKSMFADSSLFGIFDFPFIYGDPHTALKEPFSVVLSQTAAKKYFGSSNPVGQSVLLTDAGFNCKITGVMKDIPENSQFRADMFVSMATFSDTLNRHIDEEWGRFGANSYLLLKPGTNPKHLESEFPAFLDKRDGDEMKKSKMSFTLFLEPLKDVYLKSRRGGFETGNINNVYIFSVIAVFILLIACINFINLTTARSAERAKEVGIKKVIGAARTQLTRQFLGESIVISLLAFVLAVLLCVLLLPLFNHLSGKIVGTGIFSHPGYIGILFLISVGIGLVAGIYPALVLSSYKPIIVLRGRFATGTRGLILRKGLVITQFTISIALIIGTIVVYRQLNYMRNQDLGFSKEQMLVIDTHGDDHGLTFKNEISSVPGVLSTAFSSSVPGGGNPGAYSEIENKSGEMQVANLDLYFVDFDYIPQYKMQMVAGRAFSKDFLSDTTQAMILNESALKLFGYSSPKEAIGRKFSQWGRQGMIIGVVKDFHFRSLREEIKPLSMRIEPGGCNLVSANVSTANLQNTIKQIQSKWERIIPYRPFSYFFLDEFFNNQYRSEDKFGNLFLNFAILAIFISCLGLLGLASYSTIQRTREIGIRKVMGASVSNIVNLLSKDFLKLVLLAFVIATPVAWYAMNGWLRNFAYRININWWIFAGAGIAALLIALITVSFQAIKAAIANPVKSLRTE